MLKTKIISFIVGGLIKKEIPIVIGISALTWLLCLRTQSGSPEGAANHLFPQWGGMLFICLLLAYFIWMILAIDSGSQKKLTGELEADGIEPVRGGCFQRVVMPVAMIGAGLALLVFGSGRCVDGAVAIAQHYHVSELTISLTVLAAGTSLPELVVSMVAAFRGQTDIAVGNIIGSNIFNLLGILGLSAVFAGGDLPVSHQAFIFDIPVMIVATLVTALFCITGFRLCRKEGVCLLLGYVGYVAALLTIFAGK